MLFKIMFFSEKRFCSQGPSKRGKNYEKKRKAELKNRRVSLVREQKLAVKIPIHPFCFFVF